MATHAQFWVACQLVAASSGFLLQPLSPGFTPTPYVPAPSGARGACRPVCQPRVLPSCRAVKLTTRAKNQLEEVSQEEEDFVVDLKEEETGRVLPCYLERHATVNEEKYAVLYPRDASAAIVFETEEETCVVEQDDPLFQKVFPLAESAMEEAGLTLHKTPFTLTIEGLDAWGSEEDSEDEDDDEEAGEDEEGMGDDVEVMADLDVDGEPFYLVRYLEPVMLMGKADGPTGRQEGQYVMLNEEEDERVSAAVEELMEAELMGE